MSGTWEAVAFRRVPYALEEDVSLTAHRHVDKATWAVLGWTGTTGGRPRLTMVWLGVGEVPNLSTFNYEGASGPGAIDSATLRSLNLTEAASQWSALRMEAGAPPLTRPALFGNFPHGWLDTDAAKEVGFRTVTDLRAAVDRLEVAFAYAELVAAGDTKPAATLSERLDLPIQTVRARLQRARQDDYLSSAPGKVGGEVTDKARILNASLVRYLRERSGDWLDEGLREQIIKEAIEEGWVFEPEWDEDIGRDR
jgi:hypothetical protein